MKTIALRHILGGKKAKCSTELESSLKFEVEKMSEYSKSLDPAAIARYVVKLQLLGLAEADDPFAPWNGIKFVDNMKLWPRVEYPHIFCYFMDRPGVYTRAQLMQWKSLDAYNYFQSGHVCAVEIWPVDNTNCILRAFVNPSQRSSDKAHHSWVAVKSDGQIITAHCTCMAG